MSLKRRAAAGVKWTGFAFAVAAVVRVVVIAVLARILAAEDFGMVASLGAVIAILQTFGDFGLANAIISRPQTDAGQLSSLFWLGLLVGAVLCIALWTLAPLVARAFSEPRLESLVGVLSLRFLVSPISVPFSAVLQRDLEFRTLAALQMVATVTSAAVTLALAASGAGVMAMVWGELAGAAVHAAVVLVVGRAHWRPARRFRRDDLRGYLRFGLHQIGDRALNQLAMNIDYILVGAVLGPGPLGVYSLAFELVSMPARMINPVFTRVALPVFARMQNDHAALSRGYIELNRVLALIQFPLLVGIGVLADRLVPIVFGPGWDAAVPLIQILAVLGAFRVVCNLAGSAFLAKGRSDVALYWAAFTAVANLAIFWAIVGSGLAVLAWGWVILIAIYWMLLTVILHWLIELPVRAYLTALARPALINVVLAAVLVLASRAIDGTAIATAGLIAGGVIVAGALTWALERTFLVGQLRVLSPREAA